MNVVNLIILLYQGINAEWSNSGEFLAVGGCLEMEEDCTVPGLHTTNNKIFVNTIKFYRSVT